MTGSRWSFATDIDLIVRAIGDDWHRLDGARLMVSGGTGLIGRWLIEALLEADRRFGLGVSVTLLTRNGTVFHKRAPHLAGAANMRILEGDIMASALRELTGSFTHIIHAATDASADLNENDPMRMFGTIVDGTRNMLDLAARSGAERFLFLSSGAVYGPQPWTTTHLPEDWPGGPDCMNPRMTYAEGKRAAEMLCAIHAKQFGLATTTARIFAVLGPMLSLDSHFAAGNFIRDAMAGNKIVVQSSGRAVRSYLYMADLTIWLWTMLLRAAAGSVYNVGSDDDVSIAELAARVARILGAPGHEILGQEDAGWNPGRYAPSIERIGRDLGLRPTVSLDEAIRRTALWNGWRGGDRSQ